MISLILADTELERVPSICTEGEGRPRVCSVKDEQLRGILILDSYIHHHIVQGMEGAERRGRPDIVHSFLVLAQNSRACRQGKLRCYVHTRADEAIIVGPRFQVEQNYLAFLQGMSELILKGAVGAGEEGMILREEVTLKLLLHELMPDMVVALTPSGKRLDLKDVLEGSQKKHIAVIIGGFPEGDYRSPVYEMAEIKVSLDEELLTVPDVTAQVLASIP